MVDRAVVLAVGSTSHQSQLIYDRPRAMLPVLGKPLVARTMERFYRAGIEKFTVIVGYDEGAVASYLNAHWFPNISLEFVVQPSHISLSQTLSDLAKQDDQPFILAAYNSLTHSNFLEHMLKRYKDSRDALVICGAPTTLSRSTPTDFGVIKDQTLTAILSEKPSVDQECLMLIGLAWCGTQFNHYLAEHTGTSRNHMMDIFRDYVDAGGYALAAETSWILPLETDYDLLTVNKLLLNDGQDTHILSEIPRTVEINAPVRIDPQVSIALGARIGPHVYLESGCSIGPNAVLENTVVLQNAIIPAGSHLKDMLVSSRERIRL